MKTSKLFPKWHAKYALEDGTVPTIFIWFSIAGRIAKIFNFTLEEELRFVVNGCSKIQKVQHSINPKITWIFYLK